MEKDVKKILSINPIRNGIASWYENTVITINGYYDIIEEYIKLVDSLDIIKR
ncbi:hypothetical protein [Clostridium sp. VAP52]|uniref:hypothetical protein n=1 Tax=Clostridium sp. VAP52 TaxID=2949977 RepID=UPI00207B08E3|nr:hypothetical protein [Clostridium sp. VAP52]